MTNELLQCLECSRPRSAISTCKHKARWAGYQHIEEKTMVEMFEWKWSIPQCRRVVCEIRGVTTWPKDIRLPKT